jgi:adenylosuccinate synthase
LEVVPLSTNVLFGGQAGSEGKGKFVGYMAIKDNYDAAICNFYTNAGHTWVSDEGKPFMVQQIPQAVVNGRTELFIGPGAGITLSILERELSEFLCGHRLHIHPRAMIINDKHKKIEAEALGHISSTQKGCGAAQADKIMRGGNVMLARDVESLRLYLSDTEYEINNHIEQNHMVMIEGSQGFDLDINYGMAYPYTTSRQTHVGQVVADCGVPIQAIDHVIAVMRCHPIRVGNQFNERGEQIGWSGPMGGKELTWGEITAMSGSPKPLLERTTVTQKVRRIFEFDFDRLQYMVMINRPTQIAMNFVNYINYRDYGVTDYNLLSQETKHFIKKVEDESGVPVTMIGTGPKHSEIVDLRQYKVELP